MIYSKKLQIAFFLATLVIAFPFTVAHADTPIPPTPTWTPRPTRTPTPTSALTSTPLPTPSGTPEPLAFQISQANSPSALPTDWATNWQDVTNQFGNVGNSVISITTSIDTRTNNPLLLDSTDPFSMARGIAIVLSDFEWIQWIMEWMTFALLLIITVEGIRLAVSLWGIIQRIIDLIKLFPFL